jgi:hypothetical protein
MGISGLVHVVGILFRTARGSGRGRAVAPAARGGLALLSTQNLIGLNVSLSAAAQNHAAAGFDAPAPRR